MSGGTARCVWPIANLHERPDGGTECVSQCLFGERVETLSAYGRWWRVRGHRDGYAGWIVASALQRLVDDAAPVTHLVGTGATLLFESPDIKSPVRLRVPLGAALSLADKGADGGADGGTDEGVDREADGRGGGSGIATATSGTTPFARVRDVPGGDAYVWRAHCRRAERPLAGSPVGIARRLFAGTPYLWGGRTPDGADCSGLVQAVALALGLSLPRDSGEQERFVAETIDPAERAASDLVFWPGHVGLLVDADTLFHATAHVLASVTEPLADVVARAGPPSSIRRLPLG